MGSTSLFSSAAIFGRKYQLTLSDPADDGTSVEIFTISDSDSEPEALRITFDVSMQCYSAYWEATIDIYNMDVTLVDKLLADASSIRQGLLVTLKAGYQNGNFDVIWTGPVFQATWARENVVDFKLSLHCIFSLVSALSGSADAAINASLGTNQTEIIRSILRNLGLKADFISQDINQKKLSRGKKMFGDPDRYLTWLAEDNQMVWFLSHRGLAIGPLLSSETDNAASQDPAVIYTPTTGLLDTPVQTQNGVNFAVLLDPRLQARMPLMTVAIDQAAIRELKKQIGELILPLDQNGIYIVGAVRHVGDSRGGPWYTAVTGYTRIQDALAWGGINANINR